MPPKSAASVPIADDGKLMFTFAHDLRSHLRTVVTRIQLVQAGSGAKLSEEDNLLLQEAVAAAGQISDLLTAMVSYCTLEAGKEAPGGEAAAKPPVQKSYGYALVVVVCACALTLMDFTSRSGWTDRSSTPRASRPR